MEKYYGIKVTTDNEVTLCVFDDRKVSQETLCEMIGNGCIYPEVVHPRELYLKWKFKREFTSLRDQAFVMLVDEDVKGHSDRINYIGSMLYGFFEHGSVILGNILFMAKIPNASGNYDIVAIRRDSEFERLCKMITDLADNIKAEINKKNVKDE